MAEDGRKRVIIEGVKPQVDGGRFAVKRSIGDKVVVEADAFTDGHDSIYCLLRYRKESGAQWIEAPMRPLVNDRWRGEFSVSELGRYRYTVTAWVDHFLSWRADMKKRAGEQDILLALLIGAELVDAAAARSSGEDQKQLKKWASGLRHEKSAEAGQRMSEDPELAALVMRYPDRQFAITYDKELTVMVEPERARYSTWYELFPRSASKTPGAHGTFKDCEAWLPYVAAMGFDVLYFPPIHPIGRVRRKGKNNTLEPGPDDVGSPWAIGAEEGGHKAIHPQLGTLQDFRSLVDKARSQYGIEIALDIAFQCAPDHPYVKEHPQWFRWRPDGTVQYAENPPKKYQDIYPFNFETEDWRALWEELKSVFTYWIEQGVTIFRVDNPHTKPFPMWEWIITEIKKEHPETIFLAEAFTRPKVMHRLAKLGYTQSYTYFAWRNTKWELTEYFTELTQSDSREYFRPNPWPNTPDILTEYLQFGGRPAFVTRLVLAATLAANYGIYGPAFELFENVPRERRSEEYLYSEKYEIKQRDLERPDSLREMIAWVNRIRRENPALQFDWNLRFHRVDNEEIICYSKATEDLSNVIVTVVNLDPYHTQSGWVELSLDQLGIDREHPFQVHDLLGGGRYLWHGPRNYVELNPHGAQAHIFRVRRGVRTERDFDPFV
ncbi:MAG TPA: alpha-1,4-glucan--maltose-1-phosphate maltosyltransferase [Burkholderiales bacterium]|nr:alpha-1,4-glucan--maltose-1-phosphate maltosyltransferase [Burkholderiales bacterium]